MTDHPSPEQQLAEVIERNRSRLLAGTAMQVSSLNIAAAIVAAVNSGDIDPILPDKGAWLTSIPAAELVELRALKAKVDGCKPWGTTGVTNAVGAFRHATTLLAWLRESTDD